MTGDGVQQHYALQEDWQRLFATRLRQWAILSGHVSTDASREAIDRALSEALHERGVSRGASPSSVKKWRTGRFAPPPAELLVVIEALFGTGSELSDLLASITRQAPGNDADPRATSDDATRDDHRTGAGSGGRGPDDPAAGAYPFPASGAVAGRHRRRRGLVVAAVVTATLLVAVALIVNRRSSDSDAGQVAAKKPCETAVGSLPADLSSGPGAAELTAAFTAAYREAGGRSKLGCPTAPAERWELLLVQTLPGPVADAPAALVVLASAPSQRFYLNAALWASYQLVGGRGGSRAQTVGGTPEAVRPFPDGHVEVTLSRDVVLVAEEPEAPYFYIPARYVEWWRANQGQLGLPMGNPWLGGVGRQDTQHGYATVDRNVTGAEPQLNIVASPAAELPDVGQGDVIITAADGTNWWIPSAGHRQWIINTGIWSCLGGKSKTVGEKVPGAAVATLEYAGIATCDG